MVLYLFRHGIAINRDDPRSPAEADRFLTERGIVKARAAASGLLRLGIGAEVIFSSPWLRARQSADILIEVLDLNVAVATTDALLWDAHPSELFEALAAQQSEQILCVGHAPHLDNFLAAAVGNRHVFTAMKKASLAVLEGTKLGPGGLVLRAYYPPRALRALGK